MYKRKDYMVELVDYLKKNLKKGYPLESLKWALINQGYSKIEVEKAIVRVNLELAAKAPILETKPVIKYELIEPKQEDKKPFWKRMLGLD